MKNNIKYIGLLVIGLLLGWFLFGGPSEEKTEHNHSEMEALSQQWTCSMHPQILRDEEGSCPVCGMDLIPADVTSDGLEANQFRMTKNAMALANIQTMLISEYNSESQELILSGKIVENENNKSIQAAHFGGRIEKLYVKSIGEVVKEGQLLALVYSPELVTAQNELLTALELKEEQPALYVSVKNKLKLWKLSEAQIQKIEDSKKIITNFPIYANVHGVVTDKLVEEGTHVKEGGMLFKITNLNSVWAEFDVYEKQIASVKKGATIRIVTNTNLNVGIQAKVSFIDPLLNTTTRTVKVRVELDNSHRNLKPGMFVQGTLSVVNDHNTYRISVPKTAILWTGKRSVVYVKSNSSAEAVFEMRQVVLGASLRDSYEIESGLKSGEEIVINGAFTVDAAAQLQGKNSMMNADGVIPVEEDEVERLKVAVEFQEQLKEVVLVYIEMKDNLVKSDATKTKEKAFAFETKLAKVDMKLLKTTAAHKSWMAIENKLKVVIKKMNASSDIKIQRDAFMFVSDELIEAVQIFGVNQKIMKQFCPMANNNKGASWLSLESTIRNPYYGDVMLSCGEVKEVIE